MKNRKIIAVMIAAATFFSALQAFAAPIQTRTEYPFGYLERKMETLDRGLVAMQTEDGIYLSWRLMNDEDNIFGSASQNVAFEIYRDGVKIGDVTDTTNYTDKQGTLSSKYTVVSSFGDESKAVSAFDSGKNYFDIPLERPAATQYGAYTINDTSVGDLDGDGEYELIVKWDSNGKDNSQSGTTGDVLLDAYHLDGTRLWDKPINLGKNIRAGAHYTQFLVYDFDGDGKAELTCKTAPGSKDANGDYVSEVSLDEDIKNCDNDADYRNSGGYILTGDEYFTIFDGDTGEAVDTIYYPNQRLAAEVWGDSYGNRLDRFTAAVAYMDGEKPYAVYMRGYYMGEGSERQAACAISFDGERLSCSHSFDTYDVNNYTGKASSSSYKSDGAYKGVDGYAASNSKYAGEGNHNCTVADVDGDGKDEVLTGAICYGFNNDKLTVEWCTFLEHGDALHIGDYDPIHDGYEFFTVHEDGGTNKFTSTPLDYGMSVIDAATGDVMFHRGASGDTGRGMMANVGAGGYYQFWGAGSYKALGNDIFEAINITGASSNFRIFWDGDLYDELMDGQNGRGLNVTSWDGKSMAGIFSTEDCISNNGTKANPCLQADILGDWREEIIMTKTSQDALRVYVSDIPTEYKMMTLMHDSVYRSGVANEQTGYNQPPHIGFYLGETSFSGDIKELRILGEPNKTEYGIGDFLDTAGLRVAIVYENDKEVETTDYLVSGFDANAAGEQEVTVSYGGVDTTFTVTVKSGFAINDDGLITGYRDVGEDIIIVPEKIDGKAVKGFADNALKTADIANIYIYADDLTYGSNVFNENTTVHGYEGSTAQSYCEANNIPYAAISIDFSYMADVDYEDAKYKDYISNFIVTQSQPDVQKVSIDGITYASNPRNDAWPDATTGIRVGAEGLNTYLIPVAGEFSTGGRNSWLEINDKIDLNTVSEYTLKFDIMYPTNHGTLLLTLTNGTRNIDSVEYTADLEVDTWYTYTYQYDANKNIIRTISKGNSIISTKDLGKYDEDTYGVNHIEFTRDPNGLITSDLPGGWGNHGYDNKYADAYMDNIQVYTPELASAKFVVTDSYDCPIEGAEVTMSGVYATTDSNGEAKISAESGQYTAQISANGYNVKTANISLLKGVETVNVRLDEAETSTQSISFKQSGIKVKKGGYAIADYTIVPASSTVELKSLDPQIVSVDESGLITAVNEGTARITVTTGGISDTMTVTVIDNDYTSEPASIGFSGDTRIMSDRFSGGQRGIITANVYDQNGAVMYEDVDFAVTDGIEYTADGNRLMYTVNNDVTSFTIKASCGGIEETANITVVFPEAEYNQYIKSGFDGSLSMLQGKEAQAQTLDAAGITLNVGNRTGGGDNYSGFVMSNGVLRAQAGKYNNADRNAYITLAAPAMSKSGEYMFKTSIMFDAKATDITASIKGGGSSVVDLKVGTSGIEKGVWYDYYIIVNGDTTTQLVKNTQTGEISKKTLDTAVSKIDRIDITGSTNVNQSVSFDNMLLASSAKVLTSAVVSVTDESGNPVEGATVISSLGSGVTRLNGKATIPCFAGGNEFIITRDNLTVTVSAEVNVDYTPVAAVIGTAKGKALDDKTCFISNIENALILKAAYSDNNALTKIERESHIPGKAIIRVGVFSDNNAKTFVWDDNLKPISNAFE